MKPFTIVTPPRFEDEYPEEAAVISEICEENGKNRKRNKPFFLDAVETVVKEDKTIGRNDPCPCGSGKKYKKCCL